MVMPNDDENNNNNNNKLDLMRRIRQEGRGGEALWTAPTKREEIVK